MNARTVSLALLSVSALAVAACSAPTTTNDPYGTSSSSVMSSESATTSSSTTSSTSMSAPSSKPVTSSWTWDGAMVFGKHEVVMKTSKGDITIELDADASPKTVTNFMALAASGYYDNLTFHRVIPGFMIQGGDPNGDGTGGNSIYGGTFEDEININKANTALYTRGYKAGVMAMANAGPNTNGSQFFIMESDYPLSPDYTIFGKVTKGQDVVSAIAKVNRDSRDKPTSPVTFSVKIVK